MEPHDTDWEPLPDDRLAGLPGEESPTEAAARRERAAAAATAHYRGQDPSADLVGAGRVDAPPRPPQMRSDADASPTPQNLVDVMRSIEPRRPRESGAPAQPQVRTVVRAPAPQPAPGLQHPRAGEPWFKALPQDEQSRLHRAYAAEQGLGGPDARSREVLEWFWVAYVVFFLSALPLMLVGGLDVFARMAMAGCTTGVIWQVVPRTRMWCSVSALAAYLGIVVAPNVAHLVDVPFEGSMALGGAVLVIWFGGVAAAHQERPDPIRKITAAG